MNEYPCCLVCIWAECNEDTALLRCTYPKRKRNFNHDEEFCCRDYTDLRGKGNIKSESILKTTTHN